MWYKSSYGTLLNRLVTKPPLQQSVGSTGDIFVRLRFILRLIAVMTALFGLVISTSHARQPSAVRIIRSEWRQNSDVNSPVAITKIKTAGLEVFFDKKFIAEGDWLNDLTFTVVNR